MREIEFRGFSISKKQWVYGYYNYTFERGYWSQGYDDVPPRCHYIDTDTNYYEVYSQSVGQYTGLRDKNNTKIYENDIVKHPEGELGKVVYVSGSFQISSIKYPNRNLSLLDHYSSFIRVVGDAFEDHDMICQ